ncbi:carbohydrate ABC transporter permease [Bosea sp. PAMC 26642]|uniref:carbohydrate ABC transporter permease n=1 Tax=Bosea sp. (strain PAMC 26642) TaxID=1792307 RepID=UPI0007705DAF|nr:sugar ABC transporter permease [Bosea sp. PAMC 26642]AMJ60028.1 sugar ABC transporter permease [Bosea sp. PAMC 26642]
MATLHANRLSRIAVAPSVTVLLVWMIVPLALTVWFSLLRYNLLDPGTESFAGLGNYRYFLSDPAFFKALFNTLAIVVNVVGASVVGGILLALLLDQPIYGRGIVRIMIISPFFVMPTVSALVWKNMMMHPVSGILAAGMTALGLTPIDWIGDLPLTSVSIMLAWQWLPFATLILLTSLQSLDQEQKDAAEMDGAGFVSQFVFITLPHLARPMAVIVLIETIFLLNVFAEIYVTGTGGTAGNLSYLVYFQGLLNFDVGGASAGGIVAVVLANIVAVFLIRIIGRNLDS